MSIDFKWPNSSNKGTALLKLLHQRMSKPLFKDDFVHWFVDDTDFVAHRAIDSLAVQAPNGEEEFQRVAFWYSGLRERYFDELIEHAIKRGARQLLLLGSGFDTRYLRLKGVSDSSVQTFEVDLQQTISEKREVLTQRLGTIPPNLHLLPFDFNSGDLSELFALRLDGRSSTVCIWQGVSYYLPRETVENVLRFMSTSLPRLSTVGFDCCSPLMLAENNEIPGIRFNISQLMKNGEPYLFGMESDSMALWLKELGFSQIHTADQRELEQMYAPGISLPEHMWYVVSARVGGSLRCRSTETKE